VDLNLILNKPDCAWSLADLASVPQNGVKVMSTFACGGGSSMGYKRAGCTIVAANDIGPEMAWHYKRNLNPPLYYLCPIKDLITRDLPPELFELDILDGSPPCSTFSMAGSREKSWGKDKHFREGQAKQVLSDLFFDYLDLVERLKPKVAIAENVKGMILGNAKGYTKLVMSRFREIGYRVQLFLVNAADCGAPQRRERVFFVALRDDLPGGKLELKPSHRWISAGEATADLCVDESGIGVASQTKRLWDHTNPGESLGEGSIRLTGKRSRFTEAKLSSQLPSMSLTSNSSAFYHWSEPRRLTFREWKRLGSFPDDYHAKTDKIGKYMIGMSVPPKMTEQVAKAVIEQWLT
jgi:DNA (cytosine-5)-methyltransferase 1